MDEPIFSDTHEFTWKLFMVIFFQMTAFLLFSVFSSRYVVFYGYFLWDGYFFTSSVFVSRCFVVRHIFTVVGLLNKVEVKVKFCLFLLLNC